MSLGRLVLIVLIAGGVWQYWHTHRANAPVVAITASPDRDWEAFGHRISPLEKFEFQARVLGTEHYSADREAQLSPVDLALGWGPMADPEVLARISISQSNRFYYWRTEDFPIPRRDIEIHSANMHMIPASREIERALRAVRPGQCVSFSGYLIEARSADGWRWRSSLTREDTGAGACELVWVEKFAVH